MEREPSRIRTRMETNQILHWLGGFYCRFSLILLGALGYIQRIRVPFIPHLTDFYMDNRSSLISIGITVLIIDNVNEMYRRRAEKERLILQMGSPDYGFAIEAARQLSVREWLFDGSLERAHLQDANLQGAHLGKASLQRADLLQADLQSSFLGRANLKETNLMKANLREANLWNAYLERAYLGEADLQGAYLQDAYMVGAYLKKANLEGANVRSYLERAHLEGAKHRAR